MKSINKNTEVKEAVEAYRKKRQIVAAAKIIGTYVLELMIICAVAFTFWYVWLHKTDLDVLYLIGYYAIFGSLINSIIVIAFGNSREKLTRRLRMQIKIRTRIFARKLVSTK